MSSPIEDLENALKKLNEEDGFDRSAVLNARQYGNSDIRSFMMASANRIFVNGKKVWERDA